jgi:lipopolysaccharide export system protein LptC
MRAERGHLSKDAEQVDLYDNVRIQRAATAKDPELVAMTSQLTVLPNDEKAFTRQPVLITQGKSWVKGVGLQVDNRAQTYVLESQAFAVLESKHAKK